MSSSSLLRRQHLQFRSLNGNVIIKEKMVGHHIISSVVPKNDPEERVFSGWIMTIHIDFL